MGLLFVVAMTATCIDARLWRPDHAVSPRENPQVGEAQAWWSGRLDLNERHWDTALKNGKIYSHFPPMFSLIAAVFGPLTWGVPHWFIVLGLVLPVPVLTYVLMFRRTASAGWATLLTVALVMGTSAWPVLRLTIRSAGPYFVNQSLALIGSLIFLMEYFGRRRIAVAAAGVTIAALSRQMTGALFLPLAYMAWDREPAQRKRAMATAAAFLAFTVGLNLTFNTLKFGHPLDSGYMYIYEGRPADAFSRDAHAHGIFSPHYIPRNLYYMNIGLPELHRVQIGDRTQVLLTPNELGAGLWWTTPLLIWVLTNFRRVMHDRRSAALLASVLIIVSALLFYHSTGAAQRGYNRYSLDYMPVLFALVAPLAICGRRAWISTLMITWSVLYFVAIAPLPHLRIW